MTLTTCLKHAEAACESAQVSVLDVSIDGMQNDGEQVR
jgi:hypothetical protein